jgi:hydrogenase/urease accessory protein HupE
MRRIPEWGRTALRAIALISAICGAAASAHEVIPAVADLDVSGEGQLTLRVSTQVEALVAGIDLTAVSDTNAAPEAADYDALRALPPEAMAERFRAFWPEMAPRLRIMADGAPVAVQLESIEMGQEPDVSIARQSSFRVSAQLPAGTRTVTVGWDSAFGSLVLRQKGVAEPYTGYLQAGAESPPIALAGGGKVDGWQTFADYIPVGFSHIVPKGLDHILFVLGLFLLSTQVAPLLWQVTAFTLAHTVTLALSVLGYVSLPASIVEPLIAASIAVVALENIWARGRLSRWRPLVVFAFGLLHGLGFAAVLGNFGLPEGAVLPALIGFNIGVELGQLAVIAAAALVCWTWAARQGWYRSAVTIPASVAIALVGGYWVLERTIL